MLLPKIVFRYSWIYDDLNRRRYRTRKMRYPSVERVRAFVPRAERAWRRVERRMLRLLAEVSGLRWHAKTITCYVVGRAIPFSDPLTVPVYRRVNEFVDTLAHELIHQLFIQEGNEHRARRSWMTLKRRYRRESWRTKNHIVLHAIHAHAYLELFGRKRLQRDIKKMQPYRDYRRSWAIVLRDGHENIVADFKRLLTPR